MHPLAARPCRISTSTTPRTPPLRRRCRAALAPTAVIYQQPSLCARGRGEGCIRYRPSSALRIHLHSAATVLPLRPFCLVPPHPLFLPVWHARDLPRTPTDRQTAVWSSGCPATRRCLPAGIDARGCIHPASGDFELRRNRANSEKPGSFREMILHEEDAASPSQTATFFSLSVILSPVR